MAASYFNDRPRASIDILSPSDGVPPTPSTPTGPRSSALSSRITSVLSTSYADLEIRDALEILDARGVENTAETRRQLRTDVQREVIQCNGEIVKDFGAVAEQLKRIGNAISSLNQCCASMRAQINAANQDTKPVLEESRSLLAHKTETEKKQKILDAFKSNFLISEAETTALTSSGTGVDDEFFRVLQRVKKIHKDCQVLLGSENQTLGLEILDQSSKNLNSGYQKLYRWVQREFKTLDLENPQISASIRRSLRVLAERPTLFQSCLDFFAEAREHTLSDTFYTALTGATSHGEEQDASAAKPIELHAHDPIRYVGDMLAWTHSSAVSEREALEVLFIAEGEDLAANLRAGAEAEPWNRAAADEDEAEEEFDPRKALNDLVGRDIAGVARVLRQRIEQVLHSHEDATLAYRIANLISFYKTTFVKLLDEHSPILETLSNLEDFAIRQFRINMRDHVAAVQNEVTATPSGDDLGPPEFLEDALQTLKQLMKSFDSSLSSVTEDRENAFEPVLAEAFDPFMNLCESMCKRIEEPGNEIFALNCLLAARSTLGPFSFTAGRMKQIDETMKGHAERLVEYQHRFFLHTSGLAPLLAAIAALDEDTSGAAATNPAAILSLPPFNIESLVRTSQDLDDFLPSALMDAKENLNQLRSTKMAGGITEEAAEQFCEDFEVVEGRIIAADEATDGAENLDVNGQEDNIRLRNVFPRTAAEIRVLLS
ncbi:oligomeric complex COG6 [Rhizodiscina lignyota]|uniref:Conserved oligomeric Golgi complex subunit 6 n=1 Tax=Rhizodiscina lignyota TaxID=1504668 RepID=A0A9P4ILI8_9PEZI|nr:oligomeric complex COG6 [Rhizodiscina lignyota]